ncbi:uncharacterized protein LOC111329605 [Stylophora pistillata]|uniref:uncharacterized protein LOC111329605 n=1 Tax=Stylophora pistillata TaxID=50429 RepID=UPI000C046A52|nr:uncharacterized protein LOC111329605 [Stylophora pistillata]
MAWRQRETSSLNRTDPEKSFILKKEVKPQGEFSRFFIQTVTKSGQLKRTGGDSWRVHIRQGPASLAPIVIDHTDGTYEVMFLALEPGNYSAQAFLDFTLCDGFRDPPEDWYIRGDIQGHKQETGILGDIDQDFIKAPLQNGKPINFCIEECNETNGFFKYIQPLLSQSGKKRFLQPSCDFKSSLVWNGFGRWVNSIWKPYVPEEMHKTQYAGKRVKRKLDDLMFYGDSTNVHFHSLARRNRLCKEMFHTCEKKYMWTYDVSSKGNDNGDFNQTIVLEEIKKILDSLDMRGNQSVFFFNVGLHYSITLNFTTYQMLIDSIIKVLRRRDTGTENEGALSGRPLPIWRSNAAIEVERFEDFFPQGNYTERRFYTNQRNQMFHTYATDPLYKA